MKKNICYNLQGDKMIQDINPSIYKNEYGQEKIEDSSIILIANGRKILLKNNGELKFPRYGETNYREENLRYLFKIDEEKFFTPIKESDEEIETLEKIGYEFKTVEEFRTALPKKYSFGGITGYQLIDWYRKNKYCSKCGEENIHSERERRLECPSCGNFIYPSISPVVIVGITKGDEILLTKYGEDNENPYKGYALNSGFIEIGESAEGAIEREVLEEVGLKVKNITYYKSQPWSFTNSLLFGFFCEVDGSDKVTLDTEELSHAEWVNRKDLQDFSDDLSLTFEMINYFKRNGNKQ